MEQISQRKKGLKISRKDFINWLIDKAPDVLSNSDFSNLVDQFYDEATFLRELLRDVKKAKAEGKDNSGFELIFRPRKADLKKTSMQENGTDNSYESMTENGQENLP